MTKRKTPDELTAKIYMASLLSASLERAFSRQDRAGDSDPEVSLRLPGNPYRRIAGGL